MTTVLTCPSGLIRYQDEVTVHSVRFKYYITEAEFWSKQFSRQLRGTNNSDGYSEHRALLHT
jgi:hypothetical protein